MGSASREQDREGKGSRVDCGTALKEQTVDEIARVLKRG